MADRNNLPSGAEIRSQLRAVQRSSEALSELLSKLHLPARDWIITIAKRKTGGRADDDWFRAGRHFADFLSAAARDALPEVSKSPTRNDRAELDDLVRNLGQIWVKYTGRPFTQTIKGSQTPLDFIEAILSAHRVQTTHRQIVSALQAAVKDLKQD
jgi:hypothetical protein